MRAAQITRFGGPDVLVVNEVARPEPRTGEVQVAVEAASINGHDTIVRSGGLKVVSGRRFPIGVGLDFVGTVSGVGAGATQHAVGDRVWGTVHPQQKHVTGSAAEYVVVAENRISKAPAISSSTDCVALVVAGATALLALEKLGLQIGQHLLIRGAAGGVGSAAVQLAHANGLHVTAVAGRRNLESVRALGADIALDRQHADPRTIGRFDGVLDSAGTRLAAWRGTLNPRGRMLTVALSGPAIAAIAFSAVHGDRRIRTFSANPTSQTLEALATAVSGGQIHPVVASARPLTQIGDAHRAFEEGGALGKHTLNITA